MYILWGGRNNDSKLINSSLQNQKINFQNLTTHTRTIQMDKKLWNKGSGKKYLLMSWWTVPLIGCTYTACLHMKWISPPTGYLYFSSGPRQTEYNLAYKSVVRVLLNYGWLNCYWEKERRHNNTDVNIQDVTAVSISWRKKTIKYSRRQRSVSD